MNSRPNTRASLMAENAVLRRKLRELSAKLHMREMGFAPLRWDRVKAGIYRSKGGDIHRIGSDRWLLVMVDGEQATRPTLAQARDYAADRWRELGQQDQRRAS